MSIKTSLPLLRRSSEMMRSKINVNGNDNVNQPHP